MTASVNVCLLLAQRKLTYTTAGSQAQQSLLLPASSSQCMLEPYSHAAGAAAASEVDKTPLVWQQRLATSSDALQNSIDMQGHTNSLSQVTVIILSACCMFLLLSTFVYVSLQGAGSCGFVDCPQQIWV